MPRGAIDQLARYEREEIDFVQMAYSIGERAVEDNLLPTAAERGIAVIVNRPFEGEGCFPRSRVRICRNGPRTRVAIASQFFEVCAFASGSDVCHSATSQSGPYGIQYCGGRSSAGRAFAAENGRIREDV